MLKAYDSNFAFWGKRNYIHGSHMIYGLFDAVNFWGLGNIHRMMASFRCQLREQGKYLLANDKKTMASFKEGLCATFKIYVESGAYLVGLESGGKPVSDTLPDDEERLIYSCNITKESMIATLRKFQRDRLVNVIIALNKKLHYESLSASGFGRWFLAKLDLNLKEIDIAQAEEVAIRIISTIGVEMTRSVLDIDGHRMGEIYFSRRKLS